MKKERFALALIVLAFFSGMVLTAATSGCDQPDNLVAGAVTDAAHPNR